MASREKIYTDAYMGVLLKYAGTMCFAQTDIVNGLLAEEGETLAEVEQAVKKGYTVILPEKETVLNDWEGTGYLILNPETGAGAYRISGGLSGGSTSTAVTIFE